MSTDYTHESLQRLIEEIRREAYGLGWREAAQKSVPPARTPSSSSVTEAGLRELASARTPPARTFTETSSAENVFRLALEEDALGATATAASETDLGRTAQATLDLVDQVTDNFSVTEQRIEALLTRALDRFRTLEARLSTLEALNRSLERRATQAESRAREAERWIKRVHLQIEQKFKKLKTARGRDGADTAAA